MTHTAACGGCLPRCRGRQPQAFSGPAPVSGRETLKSEVLARPSFPDPRAATCNSLSAVLAHVPELQSNNPNVEALKLGYPGQ